MIGRAQDRAGGKTGIRGGTEEALEPMRIQFHITVQNRNPFVAGCFPAAVHRMGETGIASHGNDMASAATSDFSGLVGGCIVDHYDPRKGYGLGVSRLKQTP